VSKDMYDADVLATIARHGTTMKWSSPQANDRWGGIGSRLQWWVSRRVQKKRWSARWRLRDRRSMHSTRSLRAWRYYASSSILGLAWVSCPSIASSEIQGTHHRCRFVENSSTSSYKQSRGSSTMTTGQHRPPNASVDG
jgi:hypothetical protein